MIHKHAIYSITSTLIAMEWALLAILAVTVIIKQRPTEMLAVKWLAAASGMVVAFCGLAIRVAVEEGVLRSATETTAITVLFIALVWGAAVYDALRPLLPVHVNQCKGSTWWPCRAATEEKKDQ